VQFFRCSELLWDGLLIGRSHDAVIRVYDAAGDVGPGHRSTKAISTSLSLGLSLRTHVSPFAVQKTQSAFNTANDEWLEPTSARFPKS